MGTEFQEALCVEHGIDGDGEDCGNNDAQIGRIDVFYYEASGGKYVPRAVFFDSGVIGAVRASPFGEVFRSGNFVNHTRGNNWAKGHYEGLSTNSSAPLPKCSSPHSALFKF
jgi:tubulin beta